MPLALNQKIEQQWKLDELLFVKYVHFERHLLIYFFIITGQ